MKTCRTLLILIILLETSFQVTLKKQEIQSGERELQESDVIAMDLLQQEQNLTVEKIRDEIIDLHKNIKNCILDEFAKDPSVILPFNDILRLCVGDNYSIIINFYDDVNKDIREITKEKVKNKMDSNFCNNILFQCVWYFKSIGIFMEMDYDLMNSIADNKEEFERKIEPENLRYLVNITENEIGDYDILRKDLYNERKFLTDFFKEKFDEYELLHGAAIVNHTPENEVEQKAEDQDIQQIEEEIEAEPVADGEGEGEPVADGEGEPVADGEGEPVADVDNTAQELDNQDAQADINEIQDIGENVRI